MQQYLAQILPGLSTSQLDDILIAVEVAEHQPDTMIVERETTAEALSIIIEGRVEVIDEADLVIEHLEQGQSFGEINSLQKGVYTESFRATETTKVMNVRYDLIHQLSADLSDQEISKILRRRYLELTIGEFIPGLQRRKRDINLDFLNDGQTTQN